MGSLGLSLGPEGPRSRGWLLSVELETSVYVKGSGIGGPHAYEDPLGFAMKTTLDKSFHTIFSFQPVISLHIASYLGIWVLNSSCLCSVAPEGE